ncbi:hypothetical protein V8E54_004824 [Elaphomyces granulatus]
MPEHASSDGFFSPSKGVVLDGPSHEDEVDTVIIGNGPSALILSYILHGHIPFYIANPPHPDPLLHAQLKHAPSLLRADVVALTTHFSATRHSYSTQALPVNVLLDALVRPQGDLDGPQKPSNLEWRWLPDYAVSHVVLGRSVEPGGLWADADPVSIRTNLATLSYASMLSLPGYSFADHHRRITGDELPPFTRPPRRDLTAYLSTYPAAVGIDDAIRCNEEVWGIERVSDGFYIRSHRIHCRHLVLASGIFTHPIPPPPFLAALAALPALIRSPLPLTSPASLLVIGSGFTAADVILSASLEQHILHIFRWDPDHRPSPLRSCHPHAYPEYAEIYRLMKHAVAAQQPVTSRPKYRQRTSKSIRDGAYEGLPNVEVTDVQMGDGCTMVTLRRPDGTFMSRSVSRLSYAVGRRGSLSYLDTALRSEVLGETRDFTPEPMISGQTLRDKAMADLEVTRNVFVIGSLTGDSLIRYAYGGCVYAASMLITAAATTERKVNDPTVEFGSAVEDVDTSNLMRNVNTASRSTPKDRESLDISTGEVRQTTELAVNPWMGCIWALLLEMVRWATLGRGYPHR